MRLINDAASYLQGINIEVVSCKEGQRNVSKAGFHLSPREFSAQATEQRGVDRFRRRSFKRSGWKS